MRNLCHRIIIKPYATIVKKIVGVKRNILELLTENLNCDMVCNEFGFCAFYLLFTLSFTNCLNITSPRLRIYQLTHTYTPIHMHTDPMKIHIKC